MYIYKPPEHCDIQLGSLVQDSLHQTQVRVPGEARKDPSGDGDPCEGLFGSCQAPSEAIHTLNKQQSIDSTDTKLVLKILHLAKTGPYLTT